MCLIVLERMLKEYDLENWGLREIDNKPDKRSYVGKENSR